VDILLAHSAIPRFSGILVIFFLNLFRTGGSWVYLVPLSVLNVGAENGARGRTCWLSLLFFLPLPLGRRDVSVATISPVEQALPQNGSCVRTWFVVVCAGLLIRSSAVAYRTVIAACHFSPAWRVLGPQRISLTWDGTCQLLCMNRSVRIAGRTASA